MLASTSEVYGDPLVHPQAEDYVGHVNPIGPRSVYDEGKRYAEALTAAYRRSRGVDTAIARIFNSYGPRMRPDDGRMIPTFITPGAGRAAADHQRIRAADPLSLPRQRHGGRAARAGPLDRSRADQSGQSRRAERARRRAARSPNWSASDLAARSSAPPVADDPQRRCPDITRAAAAGLEAAGLDEGCDAPSRTRSLDAEKWFACRRLGSLPAWYQLARLIPEAG